MFNSLAKKKTKYRTARKWYVVAIDVAFQKIKMKYFYKIYASDKNRHRKAKEVVDLFYAREKWSFSWKRLGFNIFLSNFFIICIDFYLILNCSLINLFE